MLNIFLLILSLRPCYGGNNEMFFTRGIKKVQLKNGVTLIYKYTEPLPIISVNIFIKLGSINEPKEKLGLTNFTQILLTKGTKKRTSQQIAVEIESIGGDIDTSANEDYSCVSLSITKEYFSKAMELLSDVFLNPVFPEEEFQKERVVVDMAIRSRKDHIFNVSYDLLRKNLYGEHPYAELTIGTTETIKNITRDDIVDWHNKYYGKENIIFVVVGNVSFNEVKNTIEKYFRNIPK
ncbi:MAG: M16 family metallopeptidase, partial [Planctomycetota bacterium]